MKVLFYFDNHDIFSKTSLANERKYFIETLRLMDVTLATSVNEDFDILHINTAGLKGQNLIRKARKKGAKVIFHTHNILGDLDRSFQLYDSSLKDLSIFLSSLYTHSDAILTSSRSAPAMLEGYGISSPVYYLPRPIDLGKFYDDAQKAKAFRRHFSLYEHEKVVVSCGNWSKKSGLVDFLQTAALCPDMRFIWFGNYSPYSIPAYLRKLVTTSCPPNVVFSHIHNSDDAYEGAFYGADAFLFPSMENQVSRPLLEALAAGKVTVVRDLPAYQDWLTDGVHCAKGADPQEYAEKCREAVQGKLNFVKTPAQEVALKQSIYDTARRLKEIYQSVFEQKPKTEPVLPGGVRHLNIALFSDTFPPDINGVAISVSLLRKALEDMGHTVYVVIPCEQTNLIGVINDGGVIQIPCIKLEAFYGYRLSKPYSIRAMRILENLDLDVVHIHTDFTMRFFGTHVAKKLHLPLVYTYHTMYEDYTHYAVRGQIFNQAAKKLVGKISKSLSNSCSAIIAPTDKTKRTLQGYGIQKQISVVPTGIDLSRFRQQNIDQRQLAELQDQYELQDFYKIVYVGRLAQEKSVDMLIDSMPHIVKQAKDVILLIVGYGPDLERLQQHAEEIGVAEHVIFTGKQPYGSIPLFYHLGDVFASASVTETQGLTYIEAMACSLPILARHDECVDCLLEEGRTGYYFDTPQELARKVLLHRALDQDARARMGALAKEKTDAFSIEAFGRRVSKVYQGFVTRGRGLPSALVITGDSSKRQNS